MNSLFTPPIKNPIAEKGGIVNLIWNNFFLSIYKLFSQPSYGSKPCTFTINGITGAYSTSYKWISDRDFVHFYITLVPTASIALSGASILPVLTNSNGFNDAPLSVFNVNISLFSGTTQKDFRSALIDTTGLIKIPDISSTTYSILISGSFLKTF